MGSKGDRQTRLICKNRDHCTPRTFGLELDPGWLPGLSSGVYVCGVQTSAIRKDYMLLPILLKPPLSPSDLHSFSQPYHFHPEALLRPLHLGCHDTPPPLPPTAKSLIPHPLLRLLSPHLLSFIPPRGLRGAPSASSWERI